MLAMFSPGPLELIILMVILGSMLVFTVLPFWMIFQKAGFPGWYSLGMLIPLVNIIALFYLAFGDWPALEQRVLPADDRDTF